MNHLPGLLIEYIISGAIALIWIILLLHPLITFGSVFEDHNGMVAILAVPVAYTIGMTVDMAVYPLIVYFKKKIRDTEQLEARKEGGYLYKKTIPVAGKSFTDQLVLDLHLLGMNELIREINWRSSRDRIARGMILNVLGFGIALTLHLNRYYHQVAWLAVGIVLSVVLAGIFGIIWQKFEKISYRFQLIALLKLKESNKL